MDDFLLENLYFIKAHQRFPLKGIMLYPLFALFSWVVSFTLALLVALAGDMPGKNSWVLLLLLLIPGFAIRSYLKSLRCPVIATPFTAQANQQYIAHFLQSQNLQVYTHPQSRSIFYIRTGHQPYFRKMLILIADEQGILVNIYPWYSPRSLGGKRSLKAVIKALKEYLEVY